MGLVFYENQVHYIPFLYQGVFLRVKIPNRTSDACLVAWSFLVLAHFLSQNDLKTFQVRRVCPPKNLSKTYSPKNSTNSPKLMKHTEPLALFFCRSTSTYSSEIGD